MSRIHGIRRQLFQKPSIHNKHLNSFSQMNAGLQWWYLWNEGGGGGTGEPYTSNGPSVTYDVTGRAAPSVWASPGGNPEARLCRTHLKDEPCGYTLPVQLEYWTLPDIVGFNDFTLIFTGAPNSATGGFKVIISWYEATENDVLIAYQYHNTYSGPVMMAKVNGGSQINSGFTCGLQERVVLSVVRSGTTITYYKNAVDIGGSGASGSGTTNFINGMIGALDTYGQYGSVIVSSVQLYDRALSATELLWHNVHPYGPYDCQRLYENQYRGKHARTLRRGDFMPTFSRIVTMQK